MKCPLMDVIMRDFKQIDKLSKKEWLNSTYEWFYSLSSPKKKGSYAEKIAKMWLTGKKYDIQPSKSSEYDFVCNGKKTEVKLSCISVVAQSFTFFQIRQLQTYDDIMFFTVEPEKVELHLISKIDYSLYLKNLDDDTIRKCIAFAGGKAKVNKLKTQYGKDWLLQHDLFHWMKNKSNDWPKGTVQLL